MRPRVAIYGAGQYGLEALRIMHGKGWEIVAAYNRAGPKVGRDLGELAGIKYLRSLVWIIGVIGYGMMVAEML